jgi:hypothetical protein
VAKSRQMASSASSRRPGSVTAARALPREIRQTWRRDRAFALIHDLNNVYFVLASRAKGAAAARAAARARVARLLAGTRWIREQVDSESWHFIHAKVEDPEDAFGPTVLLFALAGRDAAVERWVAALTKNVRKALGLLEDLLDVSPALRAKVAVPAAGDRDEAQVATPRP